MPVDQHLETAFGTGPADLLILRVTTLGGCTKGGLAECGGVSHTTEVTYTLKTPVQEIPASMREII